MAQVPNPIKDPESEAVELQAALKAVGESFRTVVAKVYGGKMTFGQFKALHRDKKGAGRPVPVRG